MCSNLGVPMSRFCSNGNLGLHSGWSAGNFFLVNIVSGSFFSAPVPKVLQTPEPWTKLCTRLAIFSLTATDTLFGVSNPVCFADASMETSALIGYHLLVIMWLSVTQSRHFLFLVLSLPGYAYFSWAWPSQSTLVYMFCSTAKREKEILTGLGLALWVCIPTRSGSRCLHTFEQSWRSCFFHTIQVPPLFTSFVAHGGVRLRVLLRL